MPWIPLQELRPGLTLAEDIESPTGRYRLCAGQELSASHLRLLRGWRVPGAAVEEVPAASPGPETAAPAQELMADDAADVRARFAHDARRLREAFWILMDAACTRSGKTYRRVLSFCPKSNTAGPWIKTLYSVESHASGKGYRG